MNTTSTFDKTSRAYADGYRMISNRGGTRSGKSFAILQLLYLIASRSKRKRLITCVSHSFPHLELGIVRDMNTILYAEGIDVDNISTKRPYVYRIGNSIIEFISVDKIGKALGAARDILFINEANKIQHSIVHQLMVRTTETIFIDFNPSERFWLSEHEYDQEGDFFEIKSTYLDNLANLTIAQIEDLQKAHRKAEKEIENGNPSYWNFWWEVYGKGNYGKLIDRVVFPYYEVVDEIPDRFKLKGYALDFGFSNDPAAFSAIYVDGDDVLIDELFYATGMINRHNDEMPNKKSIEKECKKLITNEDLFIVADSAEPKSIAELRLVGLRMYAVKKPRIRDSIRQVHQYNLYVTRRSRNVIHEFDNYLYPIDKDDEIINGDPIGPDHAIDGLRYFLTMKGRVWN